MHRRTFVKALLSVPACLAFTPLIGSTQHPGGLYVPAPANLADYVKFYPAVEPENQMISVVKAVTHVAYARPGERTASIQMWGGTCIIDPSATPARIAAAHENILHSIRARWDDDHYPGWMRVVRTEETGELDEEGFATFKTSHEWTRVAYVQWLSLADLHRPPVIRAVA